MLLPNPLVEEGDWWLFADVFFLLLVGTGRLSYNVGQGRNPHAGQIFGHNRSGFPSFRSPRFLVAAECMMLGCNPSFVGE